MEWYQAYQKALSTSDCRRKIELLEHSIQKKPEPDFEARARRTRKIWGYFPHLALAEAHLDCEDPEAARKALADAERRWPRIASEFERSKSSSRSGREGRIFTLGLERQQRVEAMWVRLDPPRSVAPPPPPVVIATGDTATVEPETAVEPSADGLQVSLDPAGSGPDSGRGSRDLGTDRGNGEDAESAPPASQAGLPGEPERARQPIASPVPSVAEGGDTSRDLGPRRTEPSAREEPARVAELDSDSPARDRTGPTTSADSEDSRASSVREEQTRPEDEPAAYPRSPVLTIGKMLEIRCRECRFRADEGTLEVGGTSIRLPRGYRSLMLNGEAKAIPARVATSYDDDLEAFEQLVKLWDTSAWALELSGESAGELPTPWLAGVLFFWPRGWPAEFDRQLRERRGELVALKTVRYRQKLAKQLERLHG
ncbi:MAG: hypothetical protein MI919_02940 [Holophagales bacterium]|nr:hypothetical protein [Holophagales bacterium]